MNNDTAPNGSDTSNCTNDYIYAFSLGLPLVLLVFSNIFCCVSRCYSGNVVYHSKKEQRPSSRLMEENPIYGNVTYTSVTVFADSDAPHSRAQPRLNTDSQGIPQECYANLSLKAPRVQLGQSSPQIQYSDIILVEEPPESEREDEGCTEDASTVSDLYASVQTHRVKAFSPAGEGEGYANHL